MVATPNQGALEWSNQGQTLPIYAALQPQLAIYSTNWCLCSLSRDMGFLQIPCMVTMWVTPDTVM